MRKLAFISLVLLSTLTACDRSLKNRENLSREAYIPIYGVRADYNQVKSEAAKPIKNGGKIVIYGNLLFQVETGEGIHVFDVSNPAAPQRRGFIRSFMCQELVVKNGFILTNNLDDLVVINATNPANITVVNRIAGEFPEMIQSVPPVAGAYFECPEADKGIVIGWTKTTSRNAKCSRQ